MSGSEWRPTRLTPDQLEERRLAAATLLRQGQMTQAAIARHLGVSRASVCRWAARPTANRAAAAARRPSLVTARPAAGQGCGGSGFRNRALDPEAHRGVDPAGVRRALPPALPRASPEGARLLGPAPRDPGQGAR